MGDDDAASKAMEERIKVLEEAVRNSSSQGQARWTSLLKIGAICGVVVVILLVLLGPLLPAVYSLEYVFRGGAFHDQVGSPVPVAPKEALMAELHSRLTSTFTQMDREAKRCRCEQSKTAEPTAKNFI